MQKWLFVVKLKDQMKKKGIKQTSDLHRSCLECDARRKKTYNEDREQSFAEHRAKMDQALRENVSADSRTRISESQVKNLLDEEMLRYEKEYPEYTDVWPGNAAAVYRWFRTDEPYTSFMPDALQLDIICEVCDCSPQHLLDPRSTTSRIENQNIYDEIGLTEEAIDELRQYNEACLTYYDRDPSGGSIEEYVLQFISYILTCDDDPDDPYSYGATTLEEILDGIRNVIEAKKELETYPPVLLDICRRSYEDAANLSNIKADLHDKYYRFLLINYDAYKKKLDQENPNWSKDEIIDHAFTIFDFLEIEDRSRFTEFETMEKMVSLIREFTEMRDSLY